MLNDTQAEDLMKKLISLRNKVEKIKDKTSEEGKEAVKTLKKHETECVAEFAYLVHTHTNRYKQFANHDDLVQEGYEALLKAFASYNPKKSNIFYWAHQYIRTRVARQANLHTTIRFPLKVAKAQVPKREFELPLLIEETYCPDKQIEFKEIVQAIHNSLSILRGRKRKIIALLFGFYGDKPLSINRICETLDIPRAKCLLLLEEAMASLKEVVKI